ncbi:MAG: hypothetical protein AB1490_19010 [Pseudomonadota bacterium]
MKTASVAAALLFSFSSVVALAQSGGSNSSSPSGSNAVGTYPRSPTIGTTGQGSNANNTQDRSLSPTEQQQQRNRGMAFAPNGRPLGAHGSGLGSPEQPHDEGARR